MPRILHMQYYLNVGLHWILVNLRFECTNIEYSFEQWVNPNQMRQVYSDVVMTVDILRAYGFYKFS